MCCSLKVLLTILIVYSLILVAHNGMLAQVPNEGDLIQAERRDRESPRAMIHKLQQEIEDIEAKIAENPSSPEVGKLRRQIQWNKRKIEGILSGVDGAGKMSAIPVSRIKKREVRTSGLERYMVIAQNNLFTPLGSGGESKQQEFAVTGILSSGAKKVALIQLVSGSASYYVAEGEAFGNGARLVRIRENTVTIAHGGSETELKLGEGVSQSQGGRGQQPQRRGETSRKPDQERMGDARRDEDRQIKEMEEKRRFEQERREDIERKIGDLHRKREEIKQRIMEMQGREQVDPDELREMEERIREIDGNIREVEESR